MEIINKIVENDVIFFAFIGALTLIITIILVSIIKDGKKPKKVQKVDVAEQEMAKLELEKVVKQMEKDNETPKQEITYEEEQEDNAIISYQELLSKVQGNYEKKEVDFDTIKDNYKNEQENKNNIIEKKEDINDSKSRQQKNVDDYDLRDLFKDKSVLKSEPNKSEVHIDIPNKDKKFKNSEYISPVTGTSLYEGEYFKSHNDSYSIFDVNPKKAEKDDDIVDKNLLDIKENEVLDIKSNDVEVIEDMFDKEELNFKEFSDRIKNTDDFLSTLKDLRSKL